MIVMSEGLLPNSKYVKMGHEEVGFTPIYSNSLPSSTPDSLMPPPPPPPPPPSFASSGIHVFLVKIS